MKTKPMEEKDWEKKLFEMVCAYNRSLKPIGMIDSKMAKRLKSFIHQTIDQEVKEAFRDGWLEVIGWINGEVVLDETLSDESKRAFKKILEMWIDEWKNSVKLKLLGKKG